MSTEHGFQPSEPQHAVQTALAELIETFAHMGVQVHDFQGTPDALKGLAHNINGALTKIAQLQGQVDPTVLIPADVVQYVVDGRNPDVYTREFVEAVRRLTQHLRGKRAAIHHIQPVLRDKMESEFPELKVDLDNLVENGV